VKKLRNFKYITEEERHKILQEKKNNPFIKTSDLSKKYNLYETTLNDFFRKNHCTTKELTGLKYRKYSVNDNYFNKIVSHEQAYLLGVWYSDGYLVKEGSGTKRIGLDVIDADWLLDISKALSSEAPLYKTNKENLKRIKITSIKLYDDLIKLGCFENKTFILNFPNENQVPKEFINSFILGLLDGDGSITICTPRNKKRQPEVHISFTGTKEILNGIQNFLGVEHLKLYQRFPERKNNNYTLCISGIQQVSKILKLLYKNAPKCVLKRKQDKYYKIINDSRVLLKNKMLHPANPDDNGV
jgi:hypothetical protein